VRTRFTAFALAAALVSAALALTAGAPAAAGADSDDTSATVQGSGRFSDLRVTVSKTEHLVNEVVHITWSGMKGGSGTNFGANYLQIMQCWGDEPVPDREKCQFGGFIDTKYGGFFVASRQVDYGLLKDPKETIEVPAGKLHAYVPFTSVTGVTEESMPSQFFGGYTTNEQPFGRTTGDGTGEDFFEIQTNREAPGLGCGERVNGSPRDCWLVIVPRDSTEVDGNPPEDNVIDSSPLAQSNWDDKLSIRMKFDPVGLSCPIGTAEKRLMGHEEVAEAIVRWQPKLCSEAGAIFGFSQVADDIARTKVLDADPWLDFVGHPIDPAIVPEGRQVTYAPVAVSGLGVAFNFDTNPSFRPPPEVEAARGQRVKEMKLNARLIAKLLTQSYQAGSFSGSVSGTNPIDLLKDPEFKQLNPSYANFKTETPLVSLMQPLGLTDGHEALWAYVGSDKDAVAFLAGKADAWGMKVNPRYKGLSTDRPDFPRNDLGTLNLGDDGNGGSILLQELDARPFAADMHDVARSAARGDTLARTIWDPTSTPPAFKRDPLQVGGQRAILGITDLPTARRYSLPMVALKNAAGKYVTPNDASLKAGLAQMKPSGVDGVVVPNPAGKDPAAYPIPVVSYAVTSPQVLTKADRKVYSAFIKYAVTQGQVPGIEQGKLPAGYVPLTAKLVAQSLAAAKVIASGGDPVPSSSGPGGGDGGGLPTDGTTGPVGVAAPEVSVTPPLAVGPVLPPTVTGPATVSFTTPDDGAGLRRYVLIAALALGLLAAAARPLIPRLASVRRGSRPPAAGAST